jgi:hypothetical protein
VTPETADPAELAVHLARHLEGRRVPYAIGGAIAYGFWGNPRGTRDLDVNVFLPPAEAGHALDVLMEAGVRFDRVESLRRAAERGDARGAYGSVPVDVFFSSIPLHDAAAGRAVEVSLLGQTIRILSAEDLTVLKLLFFRGKDIVDVERLVAVQGGRLDRAYVRTWLVDCVGEDSERVRRWDALCLALPPT